MQNLLQWRRNKFMKMDFYKKNHGFTLVELVLYVSLAAILLVGVSIFFSVLLNARTKNKTIAEVEQNGVQVMNLITQTIRNAIKINSPAQGTSAASLSVNVADASSSPTVFDLVDGAIRLTEGSSTPITLTSSRITATNLTFANLSRAGTFGTIHVEFALNYINPEGRNELEYQKIFYGSASLRQ